MGTKFLTDSTDQFHPKLTIKHIERVDGGTYSIIVTNALGTRNAKIELLVEDIWIKGPKYFNEGKFVQLTGTVQFRSSMKYLMWQRYENGKFVNININKHKYDGSTNDFWNPILKIHHIDTEDEVDYRLKVQLTEFTSFSKVVNFTFLLPETEKPKIEIMTSGDSYYVGEDLIINSKLENSSTVLCLTWQRETSDGNQTIDVMQTKYRGTKCTYNEAVLHITDCIEEDKGNYFLLVACLNGLEITSNKINLKIKKGSPFVSLSYVSEAKYGDCVKFVATIRSFPKPKSIIWMRGSNIIDISLCKYKGSSCDENKPVLCINNVKKEDEDEYKIEAYNEFGKGEDSKKMKVIGERPKVRLDISPLSPPETYGNNIILEAEIDSLLPLTKIQCRKDQKEIQQDGKFVFENSNNVRKTTARMTIHKIDFDDSGRYFIIVTNARGSKKAEIDINVADHQFIFISGPVVVSTSDRIRFKAIFPPNVIDLSNATWMKMEKNVPTNIDLGMNGISVGISSDCPRKQTLEIGNPRENIGAYQLSWNNLQSNIINVITDDTGIYCSPEEGNCVRFFILQSISKDALIKKLDKMPESFNVYLQKLRSYCCSKNRQMLSILREKKPSTAADLDITMLYLMFRNTMDFTTQDWGKKPGGNDRSTVNDIERIHIYRNKLSHENSSMMTTEDFNDSALDLIEAIRRLSHNNTQLIQKIREALNKRVTKGDEMDKIMKDLQDFRVKAVESEKTLNHFDDKYDTQLQQTIKDFDQNETVNENLDIGFHTVHSLNICLLQNNTVARNEETAGGMCFMNRPMKCGEKIYLHISQTYADWWTSMDFGLTNRSPASVLENDKWKRIETLKFMPGVDDELCLCLKSCSTLSYSINGVQQVDIKLKEVSLSHPVWLVIHLYCRIKEIRISTKQIKDPEKRISPSFFREY